MSDIRFTLVGIGFIFAGFLVLGIFGQDHYNFAIQAQEFGDCYKFMGGKQVEVNCSGVMQERTVFFGIVVSLIGAGVFFLVRGIHGKWDQDVKPEDKVGPDSSFPS
jgi:Na+-driven multidrug efflux pump